MRYQSPKPILAISNRIFTEIYHTLINIRELVESGWINRFKLVCALEKGYDWLVEINIHQACTYEYELICKYHLPAWDRWITMGHFLANWYSPLSFFIFIWVLVYLLDLNQRMSENFIDSGYFLYSISLLKVVMENPFSNSGQEYSILWRWSKRNGLLQHEIKDHLFNFRMKKVHCTISRTATPYLFSK